MNAPTVTRELKRPGAARVFERVARQARDAHGPHEDDLHEVRSAEQRSRHEPAFRQRLREARFPEVKTLDTCDCPAVEGVKATHSHTLTRGEWVTAPENRILAGVLAGLQSDRTGVGTGQGTPADDRASYGTTTPHRRPPRVSRRDRHPLAVLACPCRYLTGSSPTAACRA